MAVASEPHQGLIVGMKRMSGALWIIFCVLAIGVLGCSEETVTAVPEGPQLLIVNGGGACPVPAGDCAPIGPALAEVIFDAINWLGGCPDIQTQVTTKFVTRQMQTWTSLWYQGGKFVTGAYDQGTGIIYVWFGLSDPQMRVTLAHEGGHSIGMNENEAKRAEGTCVQNPFMPPGPPCG